MKRTYDELAVFLRKVIDDLGVQQKDVAVAMDKPLSTVNGWFTGASRPPLTDGDDLARTLGVDVNEIRKRAGRNVQTLHATPARVEVTAGLGAQLVARSTVPESLADVEVIQRTVLDLVRQGMTGDRFDDAFLLELDDLLRHARRRDSDAEKGTNSG